MTSTVRPTDTRTRRPRPTRSISHRVTASAAGEARARIIRTHLAADMHGRELIARDGAGGSLLLIDRDAATHSDERLIGHLAADELPANARLLCRLYAEAGPEQRRCRLLNEQDSLIPPFAEFPATDPASAGWPPTVETKDASFRLERLASRMSIPQLRWTEHARTSSGRRAVSLRECIAAVEDYEPFCSMTRATVELYEPDPAVSTTTLRAELTRVLDSPIVLNRGLREAVLERVGAESSSLSEIATRCGRVKRDSRGNQSGETSWLARRIGILPEGGQSEPTVWVHSEVLGLIARDGLGISPREVELG